ncbi:hypothetical protein [Streptomyces sp. NPDC086787]|uniref:hypothetical protein n=1 Tax=Streptomyces sp. NPDC086787 TaxID=3365759 RepID=UPI00382C7919
MCSDWTSEPSSPYNLLSGQLEKIVSDETWKFNREELLTGYFQAAVKQCAGSVGTRCSINLDSKWQKGEFGADPDLNFALRGSEYRQSGMLTMTKLDGGKYRVTGGTRIDIYKDYNFDYDEKVMGVALGVFAELHRYGLARDYVVQGSKNIGVGYRRGACVQSGLPTLPATRDSM